jgi:hypothetical protein
MKRIFINKLWQIKAQVVCLHFKGGLTTHSTGLAISLAFIINIDCSPVNSGVGLLILIIEGEGRMKNQTLKVARTILLVLIIVLVGLTAYLYFKNGKFNFSPLVTALGCLVIFLITGQTGAARKQ